MRANGLRRRRAPFAFYMSSEAHGCARKAIELLGFGERAIRTIPISADYRIKVDALDAALADDRARNIQPIAVVATAGTTNTGAIDDLDGIADVCRLHDVWLHVDAAYGGPAILSADYAERLGPLARADSLALDPHKWLLRAGRGRAGAGPRRRGDAIRVQPRPALSADRRQHRRRGRAAVVQRVRLPADARIPRVEGLDDDAAVRAGGFKAAIEENIALARYLAASASAARPTSR